MPTYRIPAVNLPALEAAIADLNKRAAKLRMPPVVMIRVGTELVPTRNDLGFDFEREIALISIEGEAPKFDGWGLVAAIERLESGENLVRCVPGLECPVEYRNTNSRCDHCNTVRYRREVFVLKHDDGRYCQVGRQCIADFLGRTSPHQIAECMECLWDIDQLASEAEHEFWGDGGGRVRAFNTIEFLTTAAICIRKIGWISAKTADIEMRASTRGIVMTLLTGKPRSEYADLVESHGLIAEARDKELAEKALEWGCQLPTTGDGYLYNLGVACRLGHVRHDTAGLMASLIPAYQRHLDELNESKREAHIVRQYVGTVGQRQGFEQLTVKAMRSFEGAYGVRTLVRFEDSGRNILTWWASGDPDWLAEGDTLDVTGTVKAHEEYKGTPQTVLQRVSQGIKRTKKRAA